MLQNPMSAKPANLISNMANAGDQQSASPKAATDAPCNRDVVQKKVVAANGEAQAADDKPQKFEQALSHAAAAQKPEVKATAAKPKAVSAESADSLKTEPASSPDIALLMSLLPALPPGVSAPAASAVPASPQVQDDVVAVGAVASDTGGRAASTPAMPVMPALPQISSGDAGNNSGPAVVAAAVANVSADVATGSEARLADKSDLFAAVLANIESPAPASVPMLAAPTHQAPTLTAVAQALPVTAPGSLDELPISHNEWPAALGHRLLWAVGEGMQKAEISVSPQDMGPINVHIRVENDKTEIRFTAAHAQTREALEASIPRLRDMFSQQGLNLSQAQVSSQNSHDTRGRQPDANPATSNPSNADGTETQEPERARPMQWRRGLVDDYA